MYSVSSEVKVKAPTADSEFASVPNRAVRPRTLATTGRPYANIEKKSTLDLIKVGFSKSHISVSSEVKVKAPTADSEFTSIPN